MDKNTLSNYGWIVVAVLVLSVMIALATPFGHYVELGVRSTLTGLFDTSNKALEVVGMSAGNGNFEDGYQGVGDKDNGGTETPDTPDTPDTPEEPQKPAQATTLTKVDLGINITNGRFVWTDGTNTYYSENSTQLILVDGKWQNKVWEGTAPRYGSRIWNINGDIYYFGGKQRNTKLVGNTWTSVTFSDDYTQGEFIWTDGVNTYYSNGSTQYIFENGDWVIPNPKPKIETADVWTDGTNAYYSYGPVQRIWVNGEWKSHTWGGYNKIEQYNVWTDGTYMYYSNYDFDAGKYLHYVLDGNTWVEKEWTGYTEFFGNDIWTDGTNTYYSANKTYLIK